MASIHGLPWICHQPQAEQRKLGAVNRLERSQSTLTANLNPALVNCCLTKLCDQIFMRCCVAYSSIPQSTSAVKTRTGFTSVRPAYSRMVVAAHSSSDKSRPHGVHHTIKSPQPPSCATGCTTQHQQQHHQDQQQLQPQLHAQNKQQDSAAVQQGAGAVSRRIAVLECEDSERWRGYTESLWKAALWEEGDEWTIYQVCSCELPSPSQAAAFDAILVSGSHYSVYEEHAWIAALLEALPQYAATGVRIFGCCFGCQVLAQALGGKVGPNPDGNFVLTIEQVSPAEQSLQQFKQLGPVLQAALAATTTAAPPSAHAADGEAVRENAAAAAAAAAEKAVSCAVGGSERSSGSSGSSDTGTGINGSSSAGDSAVTQQLSDLNLAGTTCCSIDGDIGGSSGSNGGSDGGSNACKAGGCFQLMESHGDQVLSLPPGAVLLASSPSAPHELWCWGSNVLASQFHLEFDEAIVLDKIWTRLSSIGRLDPQQAADSRARLEAGEHHSGQMLQVVKHFLKHGIQ